MTRTLVLLRHGKSAYPAGVPDWDRPLADRGRSQAELAGRWFAEDGIDVDAVLCSTAARTRQTLDRTGVDAPTQFFDELYGASPDEIFETIRIHAPADAETLLVVGHFPGMPETALSLDPGAEIDRFPTSAYAMLAVGTPWPEIGLRPDPVARLVTFRIPREEP